jgi:pentatricopeptide repeat protein
MCLEGVEADRVAFLVLLSAYSHAGLLDEGLCYFESMGSVYNFPAKIELYACMIDLLDPSAQDRGFGQECPVNQIFLSGWPCLVLAEFMVRWRWEIVLP